MRLILSFFCFLSLHFSQAEAKPICMRRPVPFHIYAWNEVGCGFDNLKAKDYEAAVKHFSSILETNPENISEENLPIFVSSLIGTLLAVDALDLSDDFYKLVGKTTINFLYALATDEANFDIDDLDDNENDADNEEEELNIAQLIESHTSFSKDELYNMASMCRSLEIQKIIFLVLDQ
jgi:hypothetical protein